MIDKSKSYGGTHPVPYQGKRTKGLSLAARTRAAKAESYDDANMRASLGFDGISRRTADRVLAYAERQGFNRNEVSGWTTKAGLRLLETSAATVLEHMRDERRPDVELYELGNLMATWCRWGCWLGAPVEDEPRVDRLRRAS